MSQIPVPQPDKAILRVTPDILGEHEIAGHKLTRLAKAAVEMIGHVVGAEGIREALETQQIESDRWSYVRILGQGGLELFGLVQTIQRAMSGEPTDELDGFGVYRKEIGDVSLSGHGANITLARRNSHPQPSFVGAPAQTSLTKSYSLRVDDAPLWVGSINDTPIGSILSIDHVRTPNYAFPDGSEAVMPNVVSPMDQDPLSDLHFARQIAQELVVPVRA